MPGAVFAFEGGVEVLEQFALARGQVDRGFHHHPAQQVAGAVAAHRLDALAAQAEQLAGLGAMRDLDERLALERGHHDVGAQRRLRKTHRHFAIKIVALALEDGVRAHVHFHVQVARLGARRAGFAFAGKADAVAGIDAGRDLHLQHLFVLHAAVAVAGLAGFGDGLAAATAGRAGLLHGEDAALHADLAATAAGTAGFDLAIFRTAAFAGLAGHQGGHFDALVDAEHGLFEVELDHVAQVGAAARAALASATENIAEDVAEDVVDVVETAARVAATHAVFEGGVAVLVVDAALAAVRQHFVGLLGFLEAGLRGLVAGIAVRVEFLRRAPVSLLQLVLGRSAGNPQHLVVVTLAHQIPSLSLNNRDGPRWWPAPRRR